MTATSGDEKAPDDRHMWANQGRMINHRMTRDVDNSQGPHMNAGRLGECSKSLPIQWLGSSGITLDTWLLELVQGVINHPTGQDAEPLTQALQWAMQPSRPAFDLQNTTIDVCQISSQRRTFGQRGKLPVLRGGTNLRSRDWAQMYQIGEGIGGGVKKEICIRLGWKMAWLIIFSAAPSLLSFPQTCMDD
ncbi:hypothetical protein AC579_4124 [Pseudocercospora musae]|uniref:Uncharacterized protein n=1 Tax=Pseudocercospora musae TaxID=113226 RepID=A0A139IDV2_9PEZI|nr:hypothetical protein AC579_4124 [Pseudocercospora musae]